MSQGAGRVARVDRQGQRVPTEASVPGLGVYLPPQSLLLLQLVWNWFHGSSGKLSIFCEPSYFSVFRVLKEEMPSAPSMRPRSLVYFCPFSRSTTPVSPTPNFLGSLSSSQGGRQSRGLRTRIASPRRTLLRECIPTVGHRVGLGLFSSLRTSVWSSQDTDVC